MDQHDAQIRYIAIRECFLMVAGLAKAWGINQSNIRKFIEIVNEWNEDQKTRFILAVSVS